MNRRETRAEGSNLTLQGCVRTVSGRRAKLHSAAQHFCQLMDEPSGEIDFWNRRLRERQRRFVSAASLSK
jgi:hypothetical protein